MLNSTSKILRHFKRGPQLIRSNSWTHWHSAFTNTNVLCIYKQYLIPELCLTNCGSNNRLMRAYFMSGIMWDALYASPSNLQDKIIVCILNIRILRLGRLSDTLRTVAGAPWFCRLHYTVFSRHKQSSISRHRWPTTRNKENIPQNKENIKDEIPISQHFIF